MVLVTKCVQHCLGLVLLVLSLTLSTWDVFSPCRYQACYESLPFAAICETLDRQEAKLWDEAWYAILIGSFAGFAGIMPVSAPVSNRMGHLLLHLLNVAWICIYVMTLAVPPSPDGECNRMLEHAHVNKFSVGTPALAAGKACCIMMLALLLTTARESTWFRKLGIGYAEGVSFHATAGWWCLAHLAIHAVGFTFRYWADGGWSMVAWKLFPISVPDEPDAVNKKGLFVFYGIIATVAAVVLGIGSLPIIRRRKFNVFYVLHCGGAAMFLVFGVQHFFFIFYYMLPGLCTYFVDRLVARAIQRRTYMAPLARISDSIVCVTLPSFSLYHHSRWAPGTHWTYIKVPSISMSWHPISMFVRPNSTSLNIQGLGPWSKALLEKTKECESIEVQLDGPHGSSLAPWQRISSQIPGTLILVAGGVGIVPWADVLSRFHALEEWQHVLLVWAVRDMQAYSALSQSLCLDRTVMKRLRMHVYITRGIDSEMQEQSCFQAAPDVFQQSESSKAADARRATSCHAQNWTLLALAPVLSVILGLRLNESFQASSVGQGGCGREGWGPGSSLASYGAICLNALSLVQLLCCAGATLFCVLLWFAANKIRIGSGNACEMDHESKNHEPEHPANSDTPIAPQPVSIFQGRPDLEKTILENAHETATTLVCVCGSKPLEEGTLAAVALARKQGQQVVFHSERSEW